MTAPTNPSLGDSEGLFGRVEAASGADRELDCLIWATLIHGGYEWISGAGDGKSLMLHVPSCGLRIGAVDPGESRRNFTCWHDAVLAYTTSLDAAATLVPEGWDFSAGTAGNGTGGFCFMERKAIGAQVEVEAATPALALTAASLRAIAALAEGDSHGNR